MKKIISLVLVLLVLLTMVPTYGYAAEQKGPEVGVCNHQHYVLNANVTTVRDGWAYYDATYHVYRYLNYGNCEVCGMYMSWYTNGPYSTRATHHKMIYSAVCDGTWQTHYSECTNCAHQFVDHIKCPAGPHSGACPVLPA